MQTKWYEVTKSSLYVGLYTNPIMVDRDTKCYIFSKHGKLLKKTIRAEMLPSFKEAQDRAIEILDAKIEWLEDQKTDIMRKKATP